MFHRNKCFFTTRYIIIITSICCRTYFGETIGSIGSMYGIKLLSYVLRFYQPNIGDYTMPWDPMSNGTSHHCTPLQGTTCRDRSIRCQHGLARIPTTTGATWCEKATPFRLNRLCFFLKDSDQGKWWRIRMIEGYGGGVDVGFVIIMMFDDDV